MSPSSATKKDAVIQIRNIYKSFDRLHVLRGINLVLHKGENISILGRSGTGKSVLIKLIVGLLSPDKGEIIALGQNVAQLNKAQLDALRLRIGFSFQNSALYDSMNIYQNLAFPLRMNKKYISKQEMDMMIDKMLDAVGLRNKINQMPSDLSGGQKKRISIARTLILEPEVMLYDEPTSGLDPITSAEIIDLINEVKEQFKTSSLIITHDLTCAKKTSDRTVMLLDGKLIKDSTFKDVFETEDAYIKKFYDYNFIH
jgi:phospholipid/cholesterol/gamma-HCH transport system ATP-binding protein